MIISWASIDVRCTIPVLWVEIGYYDGPLFGTHIKTYYDCGGCPFLGYDYLVMIYEPSDSNRNDWVI